MRTLSCSTTRPSCPHMLLAAAWVAALVSACGRRVFASRHWPRLLRRASHQATLLARCLREAACLRTARRITGHGAAVVVLSASEALPGAAAVLGGLPHLRFIHELVTTQDAAVRLLGRLARRGEKRVVALYPTAAVRAQLVRAFPHLPGVVRPFAVDDGARLTAPERAAARAAFGLTPDARADGRGGAAERVRRRGLGRPPPGCGQGVRSGGGRRSVRRCPGCLRPRPRPDRPPPPARVGPAVPADDPGALAVELDRLRAEPPPRPGPRASRALGVPTAAEQAAFLTDTYTRLLAEER